MGKNFLILFQNKIIFKILTWFFTSLTLLLINLKNKCLSVSIVFIKLNSNFHNYEYSPNISTNTRTYYIN
jgi:hypothetical protein